MDLSELPQDIKDSFLGEKETLSFYTEVDGDSIHFSVEAKIKFRCELASALISLLTLEEFRRIDDAYISYLEAKNRLSLFENPDGLPEAEMSDAEANDCWVHEDEVEWLTDEYEALENAVSVAENQITEVLAQTLKRPELGE
jgi:hypothetical protein